MATTATLKRRVRRGLAFMDREEPGWEELIDLDSFKLLDSCRCVIGQVFIEPYRAACRLLGLSFEKAVTHGFSSESRDHFPVLQAVWLDGIKKRQERR